MKELQRSHDLCADGCFLYNLFYSLIPRGPGCSWPHPRASNDQAAVSLAFPNFYWRWRECSAFVDEWLGNEEDWGVRKLMPGANNLQRVFQVRYS